MPIFLTRFTLSYAGTYAHSAGSGSCTVCSAGYYCDAMSQTECGAGFFSSAGSSFCSTCPVGHSCPGNTETEPTPCNQGQYQVNFKLKETYLAVNFPVQLTTH